MVAYKVRKADGTWYTLGSGSGAVAKIRRGDGSWAADDGTGLLAKVRKIDGTMATGVDFSTGGITEDPWFPDALEPINHSTISIGSGAFDWIYVGSTPFLQSDDGGYVRTDTVDTFLPRPKRPVAVMPTFNIRDYAWEDSGSYWFRLGMRFQFGATAQMDSQQIQVAVWGGSSWAAGAATNMENAGTYAANNTHTDEAHFLVTAAQVEPGGFYYNMAANGNFGVTTPMRPLWRSDPGWTDDTFLIVWSMLVLPPPDGFDPLSAGD